MQIKSSELAFIYDGVTLHAYSCLNWRIVNRHGKSDQSTPQKAVSTGTTNVLFFDGHCETIPRASLPWYVNSTTQADMIANTLTGWIADAKAGGFSYPLWRVGQ